MAWPFPKKDEPVNDPNKPNEPPKEKSPAELIAESLKPITDSIAALATEVKAMRPVPPQPKPVTPSEIPSVLDDENAAFNTRMTPLIQRQLEMEAKMTRTEIKQEYFDLGFGALWTQYEKEIDGTLANTALVTPDGQGGFKVVRGDPQYVRNVVDMVLGRAARQGGVRFDDNKKTFFLEGADGSANSNNHPSNTEGLTARQIKVFERMGVPLDKAKETMKKLEFVS